MKKLHAARLGALALTLTLISTCLAGGTLARYTSEVTGTGTANIAKWSVAFKQKDGSTGAEVSKTASYDFDLKDTKDGNELVNVNKIAPGDKGSFEVQIDGKGSEVAYEYKIELTTTNFSSTAGNVKFYSDKERKTPWVDKTDFTKVALNDVSTPVNKTIYWEWEGGETNNTDDTTAGKAAASPTFTVKLTAQQSLASSPTS